MSAYTDDEVDRWCRALHYAYEGAAHLAGWETNPQSRVPWDDVPEANKRAMRAAVHAVAPAIAARALREAADYLDSCSTCGKPHRQATKVYADGDGGTFTAPSWEQDGHPLARNSLRLLGVGEVSDWLRARADNYLHPDEEFLAHHPEWTV